MQRRAFLRGALAGVGLALTPPVVRRYYQVPGNAPVPVREQGREDVVVCSLVDPRVTIRVNGRTFHPRGEVFYGGSARAGKSHAQHLARAEREISRAVLGPRWEAECTLTVDEDALYGGARAGARFASSPEALLHTSIQDAFAARGLGAGELYARQLRERFLETYPELRERFLETYPELRERFLETYPELREYLRERS